MDPVAFGAYLAGLVALSFVAETVKAIIWAAVFLWMARRFWRTRNDA